MTRMRIDRRHFITAGSCAGSLAAAAVARAASAPTAASPAAATPAAATPAAAKAGAPMRIRLLGTGSPTPSLKRASSGYLVEVGERKVLFDFGPGTFQRLMQADVKPAQITDLFISHLHYDHWLDYIRLVITRWDQGAGHVPELNIHGPAGIARMTELLFGDGGVFERDLEARTRLRSSQDVYVARGGTLPRLRPAPRVHEIRDGERIDFGAFAVTARSVLHAQPVLECFGYRLDAGRASFAYSGDSGPCQSMQELATDCDVLVHMCHFLSGTAPSPEFAERNMGHLELARLGVAARVRNLVVSHVTEQMDVPGVRERLIRDMSGIYGGNLFFGEDLMEIPVGSPAPEKLARTASVAFRGAT